jgi:para-nitrobenzyl esterase
MESSPVVRCRRRSDAAASAGGRSAVSIDTGDVLGVALDSGVRTFKGIPFAAPPVGELRWKEPQPALPWRGVLRADRFGPRCWQHTDRDAREAPLWRVSEDCLYLNVWTPATAATDKLPVLVWVHGGAFIGGSASITLLDGEALAQRGIIVVSMNYRLGPFGYFAHPELTLESGNRGSGAYGFLDMAASLHWVQRNIAAFGGDPTNVTVGGQSAGSMAAVLLAASPLTKGTLTRVFGASGVALGSRTDTLAMQPLADAERAGVAFATHLGARSLAEMRQIAPNTLVQAGLETGQYANGGIKTAIDGYFMPERPGEIFAAGRHHNTGLIVGWGGEEGIFFSDHNTNGNIEPIWGGVKTPAAFTDKAKKLFGDGHRKFIDLHSLKSDDEARAAAIQVATDQSVRIASTRLSEIQAKCGVAVYPYSFDLRPPPPHSAIGATHCACRVYGFGNLHLQNWPWRPVDREIAEQLVSYTVNFVRSGDPNGPGLPQWPAFHTTHDPVMHFGEKAAAVADLPTERMAMMEAAPAVGHWSGVA